MAGAFSSGFSSGFSIGEEAPQEPQPSQGSQGFFSFPQKHQQQPPGPYEIDWSRPIARGLVFFVIPSQKGAPELVGGAPPAVLGVGTTVTAGDYGVGVFSPVTTNGGWGYAYRQDLFRTITTDFTIATAVDLKTITANSKIICVPTNAATWTQPYQVISLSRVGSNNQLGLYIGTSTTGTSQNATFPVGTMTAASDRRYTVTRSGTTAGMLLNGVPYSPVSSTLTANPVAFHTGGHVALLNRSQNMTGEGTHGTLFYAAIWNRALSFEEQQSFDRNPYQLLKPVNRRVYFSAPAPSTEEITGTSAVTLPFLSTVGAGTLERTGSSAFQQNASGYTGTVGTWIQGSIPDTPSNTSSRLRSDGNDDAGSFVQSLLRFDGIFGGGASLIPDGATITSATLRIFVTNTGSPFSLHRMLRSWSDTDTWNSLGGGVQTDDIEAVSTPDLTTSSFTTLNDYYYLDVTNSLQAWSDGQENKGWLITPEGSDGVEFNSPRGGAPPNLTVSWTDVVIDGEEIIGTSAVSLLPLTGTATGSRSIPDRDGVSSASLLPVAGTATGTRTIPSRSGTSSGTLAALVGTGTATYAPPGRVGTSAVRLPVLNSAATGSRSVPERTGTSQGVIAGLAHNATGGRSLPGLAGASAVVLPKLTGTATGTRTIQARTGSSAVLLPTITTTATGTRGVPERTGSATALLRALSGDGQGVIIAPQRIGTSAVRLPVVTALAEGERTIPARQGTSTSRLKALTGTGQADRLAPDRIGASAVTLKVLRSVASGTAKPPGIYVTSAVRLSFLSTESAGFRTIPDREATGTARLWTLTHEAVGDFTLPLRSGTSDVLLPFLTHDASGITIVPGAVALAQEVFLSGSLTADPSLSGTFRTEVDLSGTFSVDVDLTGTVVAAPQ